MATTPKRHQVLLRLPVNLHAQVVEAARRHGRSANSEMVARLEHSLRGMSQQETGVEPPLLPYVKRPSVVTSAGRKPSSCFASDGCLAASDRD